MVRCSVLLTAAFLSLLCFALTLVPDKCKDQQKILTNASKNGYPIDFYYFRNDTKETIQLTWAGEAIGVIILVTMSESEHGLGQPSDIYRSNNNGKTFEKITESLGEDIFIKRENGLQTRKIYHKLRKIYVICHEMQNKNNSVIFSTVDSGKSWVKSTLPFILNGKLKFSPRDPESNLVFTLEVHTKSLFVSEDGGIVWKSVLQNVHECFWSSFIVDNQSTLYALQETGVKKPNTNRGAFTLLKSEDGGRTWRVIMENVRKIWAPEAMRSDTDFEEDAGESLYEPSGRFLYSAHFIDQERNLIQLSVSDDGGNNFRSVYLPTLISDRFFSVLEIEKDCVFLHVDEPGDTGHGILYVSDSTGTVFTESLRRHFYPNHASVTDFFRILSIPGTFLATQMNPDTTLRTVITHNRGATWQPIPVPENTSCDLSQAMMIGEQAGIVASASTASVERLKVVVGNASVDAFEPVCGLQVSNQFSLRKRVVASPPLTTSTARGLILVHGHVATHLKTTPADVFISIDGGYTWHKGLDGPHHYQIANRGGLIVSVPADTLWVDILRFSTDGGRCWHNIPLTPSIRPAMEELNNEASTVPPLQSTISPDELTLQTSSIPLQRMEEETVVFTGLVTEPGGRAMTVAVYGYGTVSQRWRVAVVDFTKNGFITKNCTVEDYEPWYPHQTDARRHDPTNGCLLGVREESYRLKENSLCFSNPDFRLLQSYEVCACTEQDYECEYGYWRDSNDNGKCVVNPHAPPLDICDLVGSDVAPHLREIIGYRRIPGDRCQGGWEPPHTNLTFLERTNHCPLKRRPFGLAAKIMVIAIVLIIFVACLTGIVLYRRIKLLRYRRLPDVFRRCLRHSHLGPNNDFKANPLFPSTVFYACSGPGVSKTRANSPTTPHYLVPQIAHIGGGKRSGDKLDLLENEELFTSVTSTNEQSAYSEQGRMVDLLY